MDSLTQNAGWELVKEALQRLREDNDRFEQFCGEQFDELDRRRAQLAEREKALAEQNSANDEELAEARRQLAKLASVAVELADARSELTELRLQLDEQQELTATAIQQASIYEQQVRQLKQEVSSLEAEVQEATRQADDPNRSAGDRAEWMAELLRTAMSMQSNTSGEKKEADLKVVHHENEANGDAGSSVGRIDPVLSAVMAQFENLQKGKERTPASNKPGRQGVA